MFFDTRGRSLSSFIYASRSHAIVGGQERSTKSRPVINRYPRHNLNALCDACKIISGRKSTIIVPPEPERTSQPPPDEPFPWFTALRFKTAYDYRSAVDYFSRCTNTNKRKGRCGKGGGKGRRQKRAINIKRR